MSVLGRLDARIDRAEEMGVPHLRLVARWDEYLDALGGDRPEVAQALLSPPEPEPAPAPAEVDGPAGLLKNAGDREVHLGQAPHVEPDRHDVWEEEDGWWTDYPPPENFDGEQRGEYGDSEYRRTLSPEEQAVIDADIAEEDAADRARAEAQRRAYFGFDAEDAQSEPAELPPLEG